MFRLMRNTHLILGLLPLLFLGAYLYSSVRVAHRGWFGQDQQTTERKIAVTPSAAENPRGLARMLMDDHQVRGDLVRLQQREAGYSFTIRRLGTRHEISYRRGSSEVAVKTIRSGFVSMMMNMHVAHGFWHDYWLHQIWGVFVLATSIGLLLIGATGIYLWFKMYEERLIGSILLALGLAYSLTTMILTRQLG